jgi:hypothetical protein
MWSCLPCVLDTHCAFHNIFTFRLIINIIWPTDTPAHKALLTLNEKNRKELDLKFRNVHAVIKHNRPISDYVWLNELDEAKGLDHGETYNNRFSGHCAFHNIFTFRLIINIIWQPITTVLPFLVKRPPRSPLLLICWTLGFFILSW